MPLGLGKQQLHHPLKFEMRLEVAAHQVSPESQLLTPGRSSVLAVIGTLGSWVLEWT